MLGSGEKLRQIVQDAADTGTLFFTVMAVAGALLTVAAVLALLRCRTLNAGS